MDIVSIDFLWYLCCTSPFVFMLITFKKDCYKNVMNDYVFYFIISIDTWFINTSSFHRDSEVINKKFVNICWVWQGDIFMNSHIFACMLLILIFLGWIEWCGQGDRLDSVGNTQSIIVFSHITVSMEVNPWMEVTL